MQLLLTCNITDDPLLITKTSHVQNMNGVVTYDVDNYSDALSINACIRAIDTASKLFVVFNVIDKEPLGSLLKVIMKLKQNKGEMCIAHIGSRHETLEKLLIKIKSNYEQFTADDCGAEILRFFNSKTNM